MIPRSDIIAYYKNIVKSAAREITNSNDDDVLKKDAEEWQKAIVDRWCMKRIELDHERKELLEPLPDGGTRYMLPIIREDETMDIIVKYSLCGSGGVDLGDPAAIKLDIKASCLYYDVQTTQQDAGHARKFVHSAIERWNLQIDYSNGKFPQTVKDLIAERKKEAEV